MLLTISVKMLALCFITLILFGILSWYFFYGSPAFAIKGIITGTWKGRNGNESTIFFFIHDKITTLKQDGNTESEYFCL